MRRGRGAFHINHQLVINIIILLMRIVVIVNIDENTGQEGIEETEERVDRLRFELPDFSHNPRRVNI